MSNYVKQLKLEADFEGDKVVAFVRPMTFHQQLEIEDALPPRDEVDSIKVKRATQVLMTSMEAMRENLISFHGLRDASGEELTFDVVLRDAYFFDLAQALFRQWFAKRAPRDPMRPAAPFADGSGASGLPPTSETTATAG